MTTKAPTQISFALAEFECKRKITRREVFLAKMEQVVPWSRLMEVIEPYYPKSGKRGRPPIDLEKMLRMYFVQQWYGLADEAVEDAVYDSQALRSFMSIDLSHTRLKLEAALNDTKALAEKQKKLDQVAKLLEQIRAAEASTAGTRSLPANGGSGNPSETKPGSSKSADCTVNSGNLKAMKDCLESFNR